LIAVLNWMTNRVPVLFDSAREARRNVTLAVFLVFPFGLIGCPGGSNPGPAANSANAPAASPANATAPAFDGERAMEHVRKQVEFGPRPAGSAELEKTRGYLVSELKAVGLKVTTDEFHPTTPVGVRKMVNITAELPGTSTDVIIVSSHYDTKLFKEFRFVGANDGASSTGALLELARVMTAAKADRRFTYWFVFFDGEEAFCKEWDECSKPGAPDNTYGSRRFVAQLQTRNELEKVRAMILMDLVGSKNPQFGRDDLSSTWLVDIIWRTAKELGHGAIFVDRPESIGSDDHEPFLKAGIDAIDIIQLGTYTEWHTAADTLDKISPRTLKIVGDVMLASLPKIEERLAKQALKAN